MKDSTLRQVLDSLDAYAAAKTAADSLDSVDDHTQPVPSPGETAKANDEALTSRVGKGVEGNTIAVDSRADGASFQGGDSSQEFAAVGDTRKDPGTSTPVNISGGEKYAAALSLSPTERHALLLKQGNEILRAIAAPSTSESSDAAADKTASLGNAVADELLKAAAAGGQAATDATAVDQDEVLQYAHYWVKRAQEDAELVADLLHAVTKQAEAGLGEASMPGPGPMPGPAAPGPAAPGPMPGPPGPGPAAEGGADPEMEAAIAELEQLIASGAISEEDLIALIQALQSTGAESGAGIPGMAQDSMAAAGGPPDAVKTAAAKLLYNTIVTANKLATEAPGIAKTASARKPTAKGNRLKLAISTLYDICRV